MDLNEIKEIIKKEGGKIVIVEDNKPQMVIMSFDEWRHSARAEIGSIQNAPKGERVPAQPTPLRVEGKTGELTIDDLPL